MPTLNWIGKEAVVNHHLQVPFHLLKDVPELSCGEPGSGNLIVQGDNLVALKALLPYYAGQVKCIYIDPPYNTGNEGWKYNDNVNSHIIREWLGNVVGKEGETLDRHDRWLCMMYPRLSLLRRFLRDDGAIFISIDEHEFANLLLICNEIFGAQNHYATFAWQSKDTPSNDAKTVSVTHEYIVCYVRTDAFVRNLIPRTEKQKAVYKNPDHDPRGVWTRSAMTRKEYVEKDFYAIKNPKGRDIFPPPGTSWRVSKETLARLIEENRLWWGKKGDGDMPFVKRFLSEVQEGVVPTSWWDYKFAGSNRNAKTELRALFDNEVPFDTAKPTSLIERIVQLGTNPGDLVLDSFAGSGTTAHAVLKIDKEQAGSPHRRVILIEMEEKVAREVTAERVRKVAEGYVNAKGDNIEGFGGGFRFCELGQPLFDESGRIRESVSFADLARHVYFTETGEPLPKERISARSPLIGTCRGIGIYLLYNGILDDKSVNGGNVLTRAVFAKLPPFDGPKVIYCAGCRLGRDRLRAERIIVRQTPYEIKVS